MLEEVRGCMVRAMGLDEGEAARVTEETTAADLPRWTSATHLALALELEKTFCLTFEDEEIVTLGSVSAILSALTAKNVQQVAH